MKSLSSQKHSKQSTKPFRRLALSALIAGGFSGVAAAQQSTVPLHLETMVITASGYEQDLAQAPATISVITQEELLSMQVHSLPDALKNLPGVDTSPLDARDGKTGNQSISLRGLPREYTLVLIDGVRQNPMGNVTPNSFNDSQSVFIPPAAAIERIEVIRGPMSTLYGSDALGGVVNIITRRPSGEWTGSVGVNGTAQSDSDFGNKMALEAYAGGGVHDNVAVDVFGRYYQRSSSDIDIPGVSRDDPFADVPTMGQNPVQADVFVAGGNIYFTPAQGHELSLGARFTEQTYHNNRGEIGALHRNAPADSNSGCATTAAPNFCRGYADELVFSRDQVSLGYTGQYQLGVLNTKLSWDRLSTDGRTIPLGSGLNPSVEGQHRELELETLIFDTSFISPIGDRNTLTLGAQYIDPEMTDGLWGGSSNSVKQYSLFAENEWRVLDNLALTGGLRYDDNDSFSGELTPRVYAVWRMDDAWTLKGGVGRGFRTPFLEQLTDGVIGFGDQGTVPLYGNPGLEPEISTNYELTLRFGGDALTAQATLFHNRLENLIERGTGANSGQDLNIGEAQIQGVELELGYAFTDNLWVTTNYTFTDSEVTSTQLDEGSLAQRVASVEGDPLVSVPEHMANASLHWQVSYQLTAFVTGEYRSSAFRPRNFHEPQTGGNSQGAVAVGHRDSNIVMGDFKGYTLLNLGATYAFTDQLRLTGTIYNLLDKDFQDYNAYDICANGGCTSLTTGYSNSYNAILEPRRLYLSLNYDF